MIQGMRRLDLKAALGNSGKARERLKILEAIESSKFLERPDMW